MTWKSVVTLLSSFGGRVGPQVQLERVQKEMGAGEGELEMAGNFCFYSCIEI